MDFIYDNAGKPYALKYDGTTYYYVLNLQGDVISIITHWGESYGSYTYDAWGNVLSVSGDIAYLNPIRYRGYYYDSETRLYYLQSRYYDPQVKRFINADGYTSVGQGFIGYNMFAYCGNNPIRFADLDGCFWKEASDYIKNLCDTIGKIVGPDITVVYQSQTDDPDPTLGCPIIVAYGDYATETIFEIGNSERIITFQAQLRTDNILKSSVGIAINTGNYTWSISKSSGGISYGYTTERKNQTYSKSLAVNWGSAAPLTFTASISSPSGRNMKTTGYLKLKIGWRCFMSLFEYEYNSSNIYLPALA